MKAASHSCHAAGLPTAHIAALTPSVPRPKRPHHAGGQQANIHLELHKELDQEKRKRQAEKEHKEKERKRAAAAAGAGGGAAEGGEAEAEPLDPEQQARGWVRARDDVSA